MRRSGGATGRSFEWLSAAAASATVRIDHVVSSRAVYHPTHDVRVVPNLGFTFTVDVTASWEGRGGGALVAVFASTASDDPVIELVSAVQGANACASPLFVGFDPESNATWLARSGWNQLQQPGDPAGVTRFVRSFPHSLASIDPEAESR